MKKNLTELVFILDRSGSMESLASDTIGGFNSMIGKQKKEDGDCLVTAVLFNQKTEILFDRIPLSGIAGMTDRDYVPGGSTALLDAMGETIKHIGNIHRYVREEDRPEHTIFVITTDGMENASCVYSSEKIKEMIREKQDKDHWEFLFLGSNIDAVETAREYGIDEDHSVEYMNDPKGIETFYEAQADAISTVRKGRKLGSEWKAATMEDLSLRKKRRR